MSKQKKIGKFNVIDFLILLIIIVAVAFVAYLLIFGRAFSRADDTVRIVYKLESKKVHEDIAKEAEKCVGQELIDSTKKFKLGKVTHIDTVNAKNIGFKSETGETVISDYPSHKDIYITVEAEALRNNGTGRLIVNGFEISVGTRIYVQLPNFTGSAYCYSMSIQE